DLPGTGSLLFDTSTPGTITLVGGFATALSTSIAAGTEVVSAGSVTYGDNPADTLTIAGLLDLTGATATHTFNAATTLTGGLPINPSVPEARTVNSCVSVADCGQLFTGGRVHFPLDGATLSVYND